MINNNYFVFLQPKCKNKANKYYMNPLDIILLAIALAMDCFTVSIVSGIILQKQGNQYPSVMRMAFLFGFFQAMMPLLGWLGVSHLQTYMEAYDHWIAFCLLAFIGGTYGTGIQRGKRKEVYQTALYGTGRFSDLQGRRV